MVSLSRLAPAPQGPRPMNPFRDWSAVAQLMRAAFQSEVTGASLPLVPDWPWLRWVNPFINFFEAVGVDAPEQMLGYVWEADGYIVGNATLGLAKAQTGLWLLSNVAVHPSYRRRGIARALVETAIRETQRHGGKWLTLQVHGDNLGARALYQATGFRSLETFTEFGGAFAQPLRSAAGESGSSARAQLVAPSREQWAQAQALVSAHLPSDLRTFRHALAGSFQMPYRRNGLDHIGELLRGVQRANWCVVRDGVVAGGMVAQTQLGWGTHRVGIYIAPSAQGHVESLLLTSALQHIERYASRRALFICPASHTALIEQLRARGLRETRSVELMAIPL
ncbi:MAG: GNAT family N-acetyltransferase [Chloroflexota bacterium]